MFDFFLVDASQAGDGNLEILVLEDGEIVPNYVKDEGNTCFKVTFTPRRAGVYLIHTQFNGVAIRGGFKKQNYCAFLCILCI